MILALIYDCCFGKSKLTSNRHPVISVEDVVLAMEALPKDDFRKVLKRYVKFGVWNSRNARSVVRDCRGLAQRGH